MDDLARDDRLEWARRCARSGRAVDWPMVAAVLVDHLDAIEARARQVRGGLGPYWRPVEVVDFVMGTAAAERPRPPAHTD